MVTSPEVINRIDHYFWGIEAELGFLPELAEDWDGDENVALRMDWQYEWAELMVQFDVLFDAYQSHQMTDAQRKRFVTLAHDMQEAIPLLRRLELPEPLRPLHMVAASQE